MIRFDISRADHDLIVQAVDRAEKMAAKDGAPFDRLTMGMDLTATHANGCPLDLPKLLAAGDGDFGHDVFGIARHIDRETGQLGGCFLPRCAKPEEPKVIVRRMPKDNPMREFGYRWEVIYPDGGGMGGAVTKTEAMGLAAEWMARRGGAQ